MAFIKFDYNYNTMCAVAVGVSETILWMWWIVTHWKRSYTWKILLSHVMMWFASSLELLDFPPIWGLLDAHALWHAATPPICVLFYSFLVDDALFEHHKDKLL